MWTSQTNEERKTINEKDRLQIAQLHATESQQQYAVILEADRLRVAQLR